MKKYHKYLLVNLRFVSGGSNSQGRVRIYERGRQKEESLRRSKESLGLKSPLNTKKNCHLLAKMGPLYMPMTSVIMIHVRKQGVGK